MTLLRFDEGAVIAQGELHWRVGGISPAQEHRVSLFSAPGETRPKATPHICTHERQGCLPDRRDVFRTGAEPIQKLAQALQLINGKLSDCRKIRASGKPMQ